MKYEFLFKHKIYTLPTNTLYFEGRLVNQEGKVSATLSLLTTLLRFCLMKSDTKLEVLWWIE
nr:unnamed protein product [Callosobruchus analis]